MLIWVDNVYLDLKLFSSGQRGRYSRYPELQAVSNRQQQPGAFPTKSYKVKNWFIDICNNIVLELTHTYVHISKCRTTRHTNRIATIFCVMSYDTFHLSDCVNGPSKFSVA
jgi:hypothetical protein